MKAWQKAVRDPCVAATCRVSLVLLAQASLSTRKTSTALRMTHRGYSHFYPVKIHKFYVKDLTFENTIDFISKLWYIYNRFMFAFFGGTVCIENL